MLPLSLSVFSRWIQAGHILGPALWVDPRIMRLISRECFVHSDVMSHYPQITTRALAISPCLLWTSPSADMWGVLYPRQAFHLGWGIQPNRFCEVKSRMSSERDFWNEVKCSPTQKPIHGSVCTFSRAFVALPPTGTPGRLRAMVLTWLFVFSWHLYLVKSVSSPQNENWGDYL